MNPGEAIGAVGVGYLAIGLLVAAKARSREGRLSPAAWAFAIVFWFVILFLMIESSPQPRRRR